MDPSEADELLTNTLGHSDRATHCRQVGAIMKEYAVVMERDASLWQCVGLLHDLDYNETVGDRSQHGPAAADRLKALLPAAAWEAIASHDYRSSIPSESEFSRALRSADASACLLDTLSPQSIDELIGKSSEFSQLRRNLPRKEYLADLLEAFSSHSGIALPDLLKVAINLKLDNDRDHVG